MISVITTVHNGETTIAETIESIQKQTFSKFEYILIDDGSTDNTIKIIEHYKEKDPRIKLVSTQKIGRSAALNLAIKMLDIIILQI
ncbi:glycosyltransferase [Enterococcus faecium]|nr:glycosyltransferase [Enterococcus faecium]